MESSGGIWIVVAAYNEAPVIGEVVAGLRTKYPQVVVVDDCSDDETGTEALSSAAIVLRHPINLGQGAAVQTGIRFALSKGAAYVVTFDADGQHRVEDIAVLLDRLEQSRADVVIGSRFLGDAEGIPPMRRLALKLAATFTWITTGVRMTDAHNGLRVFTRQAAERLRIRQNRMAHASEIISLIRTLGLKLEEAPVTILYTEYSLAKGQRLSNAINILAELFVGRLTK